MRAIIRVVSNCAWAALSLVVMVGFAVADATVPTADIEGAADSSLVKRYEDSFIVSYEKFSYTDFVVPLSPLV